MLTVKCFEIPHCGNTQTARSYIMKEFRQRKLFVKMSFKFKEDGIDFQSKDLDGEFSKFIHFNDIEPRKKCRLYTEKFPKLLHSGLVITAIALIRGLMTSTDDMKKVIVVSSIVMSFGVLTILAFFIVRIKYYLIELEDETQMFGIPTAKYILRFFLV